MQTNKNELCFTPMLSPQEMLQRGVFGGTYFSGLVDYKKFPVEWFQGLDKSRYLSKKYLSEVNYFRIKSGLSQ